MRGNIPKLGGNTFEKRPKYTILRSIVYLGRFCGTGWRQCEATI